MRAAGSELGLLTCQYAIHMPSSLKLLLFCCMQALDLSQNSLGGVPIALAGGACPQLSALSLGQQEAAAPGEAPADLELLTGLPALRLLVSSSGHYSAAHLSVGLRSPAEAAHVARLRGALPRQCASPISKQSLSGPAAACMRCLRST